MDIIDTNLSTADTESLLAVMVSGVEEVRLGMDVTLDMEMLAQYDGKGECVKRLLLRGSVTLHLPTLMNYDGRGKCDTSRNTFLHQMMAWAEGVGWDTRDEEAV